MGHISPWSTLGGNITTVNTNTTKTRLDTCKEVGLLTNAEKTKYMLVSRHQNARQINNIM